MNKIILITKTCPEYLEKALEKLDRAPSLKVNGLTAGQLYKIKEENPALYDRIKEKIIEDRWYPFAGLWQDENDEISDERLAREILYSLTFLRNEFKKTFRIFFGKNICSPKFSQTVYNGRLDCAVLTDENENYWLDGFDSFRIFVMSGAETADIADVENFDGEFLTYEELLHNTLSTPLSLKTVKLQKKEQKTTEAEKAVIEAEMASTEAGEDRAVEIRECWLDIFAGEDETAIKKADKIAGGRAPKEIIKINKDSVKLTVIKFAEDGSGDRVIRITETAGEGKNVSVMCDELDAGFRCEIEPCETATYRIYSDGFVRETFIFE